MRRILDESRLRREKKGLESNSDWKWTEAQHPPGTGNLESTKQFLIDNNKADIIFKIKSYKLKLDLRLNNI